MQDLDLIKHYNENDHYFYCGQQKYSGKAILTENAELLSDGTNYGLSINGEDFTKKLSLVVIGPDTWAVENPDFDRIFLDYNSSKDSLIIYSAPLNEIVAEKEVSVSWIFSDDDKALMERVWNGWKTDIENKASEQYEAEKRAEEEAKNKVEETSKSAQQSSNKSSTSSTNAGTNTGNSSSSSSQPQSSNSGTSSENSSSSSDSGSSSDSTGGYSADETNVNGYCKDGTPVTGNPHAKGRANVCYGHGGWVK